MKYKLTSSKTSFTSYICVSGENCSQLNTSRLRGPRLGCRD